jgi:hypothetical protein
MHEFQRVHSLFIGLPEEECGQLRKVFAIEISRNSQVLVGRPEFTPDLGVHFLCDFIAD